MGSFGFGQDGSGKKLHDVGGSAGEGYKFKLAGQENDIFPARWGKYSVIKETDGTFNFGRYVGSNGESVIGS